MRVAVVGGGIFGTTIAIHAAREGHDVHLFEAQPNLMAAASSHNQFRLHEGFHYPRSPETVRECQAGLKSFAKEYSEAIVSGGRHIYAIAREGSKLDGAEYLNFCQENDLSYTLAFQPRLLNSDTIQVAIEVEEYRYDPNILRRIVEKRLKETGVTVYFNAPGVGLEYDRYVIAAYADTNDAMAGLQWDDYQEYQFEVCEKPVVRMPQEFGQQSIVVMDGPFGCVDPYGPPETRFHILGHVEHAIHHTNVGLTPEIPEHLKSFVNSGVVEGPPKSRCTEIIDALMDYIPALERADHIGSMFTVRTVLPNKDKTDERLTLVDELDDQVIRVFSGKVGTAVDAAASVLAILDKKDETIQSAT